MFVSTSNINKCMRKFPFCLFPWELDKVFLFFRITHTYTSFLSYSSTNYCGCSLNDPNQFIAKNGTKAEKKIKEEKKKKDKRNGTIPLIISRTVLTSNGSTRLNSNSQFSALFKHLLLQGCKNDHSSSTSFNSLLDTPNRFHSYTLRDTCVRFSIATKFNVSAACSDPVVFPAEL